MSATTTSAPGQPALAPEGESGTGNFWHDLLVGVATQSWLASMAFHMALMVLLALIMGTIHVANTIGQAPEFDSANQDLSLAPELEHFEVGDTPLDPTELSTDSLMLTEAPSIDEASDKSSVFIPDGGGIENGENNLPGLGGFTVPSLNLGPALKGGGVGSGLGSGEMAGAGGASSGFNFRGNKDGMVGSGGTKQSERAVAAALNWIARHQNRDGSWSIRYTNNCKGGFCSGPGEAFSDTGATALGLLPFLAAGQTHESKGPYQKNIRAGVDWLLKHQKPTGDLTEGGRTQMYAHGLAAIALCEVYGMTQDSRIRDAAQKSIQFIESGQNKEGGWRYTHGTDESDTSVFGWLIMALKSAQMAGLQVNANVLDAGKKYLDLCKSGPYRCEFSYMPGGGPKYSMTAVGLLTSQYLGAKRDDGVISGGVDYLMRRKPELSERDTYYWYYATQVMHNVPGPQWDAWNRQMRRLLIETQEKTGCAAGSWNPNQPEPDRWGELGGRLMVTSLSALTLEVYYRYLPLYKLDSPGQDKEVVQ